MKKINFCRCSKFFELVSSNCVSVFEAPSLNKITDTTSKKEIEKSVVKVAHNLYVICNVVINIEYIRVYTFYIYICKHKYIKKKKISICVYYINTYISLHCKFQIPNNCIFKSNKKIHVYTQCIRYLQFIKICARRVGSDGVRRRDVHDDVVYYVFVSPRL